MYGNAASVIVNASPRRCRRPERGNGSYITDAAPLVLAGRSALTTPWARRSPTRPCRPRPRGLDSRVASGVMTGPSISVCHLVGPTSPDTLRGSMLMHYRCSMASTLGRLRRAKSRVRLLNEWFNLLVGILIFVLLFAWSGLPDRAADIGLQAALAIGFTVSGFVALNASRHERVARAAELLDAAEGGPISRLAGVRLLRSVLLSASGDPEIQETARILLTEVTQSGSPDSLQKEAQAALDAEMS